MGDFLAKFENFIFDILGLALPGLILLVFIVFPAYLFDFDSIYCPEIKSSGFISSLYYLSILFKDEIKFDNMNHIVLFILACYMIGHVVKVLSIILYELMVALFDKGINIVFNNIYYRVRYEFYMDWWFVTGRNFRTTIFYIIIKNFIRFIKNTIKKIFSFKGEKYDLNNEIMNKKSIEIINRKLNMSFPRNWYSTYKLSVIISNQENLKSLAGNYLSKYNLYRSLSFINLVIFVYACLFFSYFSPYLDKGILNIKNYIYTIILVLWFVFNYKYKRYWTLCGNESLVSLFYFLNKEKLKANEIQ
ncbi:hypothetical protein E5K00_01480 [Hymenobacter aquaticus]|uniref:Uncharacterized protein n=1 Tax=Hymenobacter aquaticus TaxID=1867101 RepID=A0A4Z0Q2U4_9BACT|nr:hypothetical protein [Hymenobacter aquaticus]TGE23914.1 hypothetical protein E5K00_01480 [Hymenobacter aquaticus]